MLHSGWYQVGFESELNAGLNEFSISGHALMLVQDGLGHVRAFDAHCPHRGANLCRGGTLLKGTVRCPFHGMNISLGGNGHDLAVREWHCLVAGGMIFVRMEGGPDCGLTERLERTADEGQFVPGFTVEVAAPAELVIENAFDSLHFDTVHGIGNRPEFRPAAAPPGAIAFEGEFRLPRSKWQKSGVKPDHLLTPYRATAYPDSGPGADLTRGFRDSPKPVGGAPSYQSSCAGDYHQQSADRACPMRLRR